MPAKLIWTDAQDTQLRRLRAEGVTWTVIAALLGISRFTAIERGRRIGAQKPPPGPRPFVEDLSRDPLPAGHPRAWGPLVADTVLAGEACPLPVFSR